MVAAHWKARPILLRNGKLAGSFRGIRLFFVSGDGARSKSGARYQVTTGGWHNTAMTIAVWVPSPPQSWQIRRLESFGENH
jgi:hypothetical protein